MRIWIDAGHGGNDPGACAQGRREKDCTLQVCVELAKLLNSYGISVGQTRSTDTYVEVDKRASLSNRWGADYFVSVHLNAGGGSGLETYCSIIGTRSRKLAEQVQRVLLRLGYHDRGVKTKTGTDGRDYYAVIRETTAPAILIELGFIDSPNDMRRFDPTHAARLIATGILAAVGKDAPVISDTTQDITLVQGGSYHVKLTSPVKPAFTVGNGAVLQTITGRQSGNDYIFGVRAIGKSGQSTGVYANGKLLFGVLIK